MESGVDVVWREPVGDVNIRRGVFQCDSLSPLLFVLSLMIIPLTLVLRKTKGCYEWGNRHHTGNHLLSMDDLKLFGKDYTQKYSLVQTVHFVSSAILKWNLVSKNADCLY